MINALDLLLANQWAMEREALARMREIAEAGGGAYDPQHLPAWCTWAERSEEYRSLHLQGGTRLDGSKTAIVRDGVAVVPVLGPIFRRANMMTQMSGATSLEVVARDIAAAVNNPDVKAILLEIDSPGGAVAGTGELAGHIAAMGKKKPICAYIGGTGASAAYWLASACQGIAVAPTAIVGSIGVIGGYQKADDGTVTIVSSQSPKKNPDLDTEEGRADVQATLDSLADVFVADVARNRGVSPATVLSDFGQGGVLVGRQALKAGMVDRVSSLEATIRSLARDPQNLRRGMRAEDEGELLAEETMIEPISSQPTEGLTLEAELDALLLSAERSHDRVQSAFAQRQADGRTLSAERRGQLAAVRDRFDALVRDMEPRASEAERRQLEAEAQAIEAEMLAASLLGE